MKCPNQNCGAEVQPHWKVCPECETRIAGTGGLTPPGGSLEELPEPVNGPVSDHKPRPGEQPVEPLDQSVKQVGETNTIIEEDHFDSGTSITQNKKYQVAAEEVHLEDHVHYDGIDPRLRQNITFTGENCPICGDVVSNHFRCKRCERKYICLDHKDPITYWCVSCVAEERAKAGDVAIGTYVAGRYEIMKLQGAGGMGTVYKAFDHNTKRNVAIKCMAGKGQIEQDAIARFFREAESMTKLNHEHVVTVFDVSKEGQIPPFICMELLEGETLADIISERGKLEPDEAWKYIKPIGQALVYAHKHDVIHRDVKPANVMVTNEGAVKLLDFGLARMGQSTDLSIVGYGLGTGGYASPEQVRDAKSVDHRTDIYSLGATTYELLTGEGPKHGVRESHLPAAFSPVVMKAMEITKEKRYFSVEDFLEQFEAALRNASTGRALDPDQLKDGQCIECQHVNLEEAVYCENCSAGLFSLCPKCEKQLRVGKLYCMHCGIPVEKYNECAADLKKGKEYLAKHKYSRAVKVADLGLGIEPGNSEFELLHLHLADVKTEAAEKDERLKYLLDRAQDASKQSLFEQSRKFLEEAKILKPDEVGISNLLSEIPERIKDRDYSDFLSDWQGLMDDEQFAQALDLARHDLQNRHDERTEAQFEQAQMRLKEQQQDEKYLHAETSFGKSLLGEANQHLKQLFELNPDSQRGKALQAEIDNQLKEYEKHLQRGRKQLEHNRYEDAIREFNLALQIHADAKECYDLRSDTQASLKQLTDLKHRAEEALASGNLDEARLSVQQAMDLQPGSAELKLLESKVVDRINDRSMGLELHMERGRQLMEARDFHSAAREFDQAIEIMPEDEDAKSCLREARDKQQELQKLIQEARSQRENSLFEDAEADLHSALEMCPQSSEAKNLLREVQDDIKRRDIDLFEPEFDRLMDGGQIRQALHQAESLGEVYDDHRISSRIEEARKAIEDRDLREKTLNAFTREIEHLLDNRLIEEAARRYEERPNDADEHKPLQELKARINKDNTVIRQLKEQLEHLPLDLMQRRRIPLYEQVIKLKEDDRTINVEGLARLKKKRRNTMAFLAVSIVVVCASVVGYVKWQNWKAEEWLFETSQANRTPEAYLNQYPEGRHSDVMQNLSDTVEYERAIASPIPSDCVHYLENHSDGLFAANVRDKLDSLDDAYHGRAASRDDIAAWNEYLSNFPDGRHSETVATRVRVLEDDAAFQKASGLNTIASYREYLKSYDKGRSSGKASTRLAQLRDDAAFRQASDKGTISAYDEYLRQYPEGRHKSKARQERKRIREELDDTSFAAAQQENSIASYAHYLTLHPEGRFVDQAFKILESQETVYRANPARTGEYHTRGLDGPPVQTWRFTAPRLITSSPVLGDGQIFVASGDGNFHALDSRSGKESWIFTADGSIISSPAFVGGVVYLGDNDGSLHAIEARSGRVKWEYETQLSFGASSPVVADKLVLVGSTDNNLYAINTASGTLAWKYKAKGMIYTTPAVASGTVYFGCTDGSVYAVNLKSGNGVWDNSATGRVSTSAVVSEGYVLFGYRDGVLHAFNSKSGKKAWEFDAGAVIKTSPAVADKRVLLGAENGALYCLNLGSGKRLWQYQTGGDLVSPPTVVGRTVFVGSGDGNLYAVDLERGELKWKFAAGAAIAGAPLVHDGTVYFGCVDGSVYAVSSKSRSGLNRSALVPAVTTATAESPSSGTSVNVTASPEADQKTLPNPDKFVPVEIIPVMIKEHKPEYPRLAREAGLSGSAWVKVLVDKEGKVLKAQIAKSSGVESLDNAALEAAPENVFKPGVQNGMPIACWVTYRVDFSK